MNHRALGQTGFEVSEVSLGAWQIGGSWGSVPDQDALAVLYAALDSGVNFIDTADVYGDGRSEQLIARALRDHTNRDDSERIFVATKVGRRLAPHTADSYSKQNLTAFVERSLKNLERDVLDLVQLHCPPTDVYYRPEVFGVMDDLKKEGKLLHYGVSVEKVEEGLKAIQYPGVETIQIVFNPFRQRPVELLFPLCREKRIGILARLPLSSGLLSGKITLESSFSADDHRAFNRNGEKFDRGETFSGISLEQGVEAVNELRNVVPEGLSMANFTLRWILDHPAVSCVIPGARNESQIRQNVEASELAALSDVQNEGVDLVYLKSIKPLVHQLW